MVKRCLRWKPVLSEDIFGKAISVRIPEIVELHYRGTLLDSILSMPLKTALPFRKAIRLLDDRQTECFRAWSFGDQPGQYSWFAKHFVDWISDQGYHIELTGDEFEPFQLSDLLL